MPLIIIWSVAVFCYIEEQPLPGIIRFAGRTTAQTAASPKLNNTALPPLANIRTTPNNNTSAAAPAVSAAGTRTTGAANCGTAIAAAAATARSAGENACRKRRWIIAETHRFFKAYTFLTRTLKISKRNLFYK